MNQTQLAKHLDKSVASIANAAKRLAFQEGREYNFENKGQPGLERKLYTSAGILRLEKRFTIPEEDRYRPPVDPTAWVVEGFPPNKRLVGIRNVTTGEIGVMRVKPEKRSHFRKGLRVLPAALKDRTRPATRCGTIWIGIPPAPQRKFVYEGVVYPKPHGRYALHLEDGTLI